MSIDDLIIKEARKKLHTRIDKLLRPLEAEITRCWVQGFRTVEVGSSIVSMRDLTALIRKTYMDALLKHETKMLTEELFKKLTKKGKA